MECTLSLLPYMSPKTEQHIEALSCVRLSVSWDHGSPLSLRSHTPADSRLSLISPLSDADARRFHRPLAGSQHTTTCRDTQTSLHKDMNHYVGEDEPSRWLYCASEIASGSLSRRPRSQRIWRLTVHAPITDASSHHVVPITK